MPECSQSERDLLDRLDAAEVISRSAYEANRGQIKIYRFRLFSEWERTVILRALTSEDFNYAPYAAGLVDEIEMVRYAAHGVDIGQIKRTI